jgi:hypothetical protein
MFLLNLLNVLVQIVNTRKMGLKKQFVFVTKSICIIIVQTQIMQMEEVCCRNSFPDRTLHSPPYMLITFCHKRRFMPLHSGGLEVWVRGLTPKPFTYSHFETFRTTSTDGPLQARDSDHPHSKLSARFHAYCRTQADVKWKWT